MDVKISHKCYDCPFWRASDDCIEYVENIGCSEIEDEYTMALLIIESEELE
jgi:hypothetical protein